MAVSDAQVCNIALAAMGERQFLDNLNENTAVGRICAVLYPQARDVCLEAHPWRWTTKPATLTLTTETRPGWTYCYVLPADCQTALRLETGVRNLPLSAATAFDISLNDAGDGQLLCCDVPQAVLRYSAPVLSPALWPAGFVEAVALDLASRLAAAIPEHAQKAQSLAQRAVYALQVAVSKDANSVERDPPPDSETITSRA